MHDRSRMQEQLAAIGDRYLRRTLDELERLRALLAKLRSGSPEALKDIEVIAHRIHGSGAMFGFHEVSMHAHRCEMLCAEGANDPDVAWKIEDALQALEAGLNAAGRERGIW